MSVATFTKTGTKATAPAKLDKAVFGIEVSSHELLKQAYIGYLANGRSAAAKTKKRGEVRGGGIKPWRQKGTGRARVGSIRSPIWRGGGITFGPTGDQNYTHRLSTDAKRQAIRQALSLAADSDKIVVIEAFDGKDGKTKPAAAMLKKIGAERATLLVSENKTPELVRSTKNLDNVLLVSADYLNVYDVLNADKIVFTKASLEAVTDRLNGKSKETE